MNRSKFLKLTGAASLALTAPAFTASATGRSELMTARLALPNLKAVSREPVILRSVELLKTQGQLMLVVTSKEGIKGITQCNMQHLTSILKGLVIPHFVNQDARHLPALVDNAYRLNSNYKYAGMPLWNCIGSVEIPTLTLTIISATIYRKHQSETPGFAGRKSVRAIR